MFKPGESTLPVRQEDLLLGTLQMMVAWNLFFVQNSTNVLDEGLARIPWPCHKSIKNFASISDILLMRIWIFCDSSNRDEIVKQTGREGQIVGVIGFYNP